MIKRNGQRDFRPLEDRLANLTDSELKAYGEAFREIEGDYKTLCSISRKLRAIENTSSDLNPPRPRNGQVEIVSEDGHRENPWQVCVRLLELDRGEVLLGQRATTDGTEYAIFDRAPTASPYSKANGPCDILQTSDNPRQLLQDYLQTERASLSLFVNDLIVQVRLTLAARFPNQNLSRVVKAISRLCKKEITLGQSQTQSEAARQTQNLGCRMRM